MQPSGLPLTSNTKGPTLYNVTGAQIQRNMAQMKEQSKASERELSDEEIAKLSDTEFKALFF